MGEDSWQLTFISRALGVDVSSITLGSSSVVILGGFRNFLKFLSAYLLNLNNGCALSTGVLMETRGQVWVAFLLRCQTTLPLLWSLAPPQPEPAE